MFVHKARRKYSHIRRAAYTALSQYAVGSCSACLFLLFFHSAAASEVSCSLKWPSKFNVDSCYSATLTGHIRDGDAKMFAGFLERNPALSLITLRSRGGDVSEAIKISHMVRGALLQTRTAIFLTDEHWSDELMCASSCALIALSGVARILPHLGLHRPTFTGSNRSDFEQAKRDYSLIKSVLVRFFEQLDLPKPLLEIMLATGQDRLYRLHAVEASKLISEFDPSFQELHHEACKGSADYWTCLNARRELAILARARVSLVNPFDKFDQDPQ